jgi:hypothetical protein
LFSDGFITGARQLSELRRFIRGRLAGFDGRSESLRNIVLEFNENNKERPIDDRTLIVVSWKREEYLSQAQRVA